jgi:hypothetical protein
VATTNDQPITALVPFAALSISALVHMPFSVGFHLFNCISKEVRDLWCSGCSYVVAVMVYTQFKRFFLYQGVSVYAALCRTGFQPDVLACNIQPILAWAETLDCCFSMYAIH